MRRRTLRGWQQGLLPLALGACLAAGGPSLAEAQSSQGRGSLGTAADRGVDNRNVAGMRDDDREAHVKELNELLRGVISAVETYKQALEALKDEPGTEVIRRNLMDHEAAAKLVSAEVQKFGGTPTNDSGAWGTWAKTVTGTAKLLGDTAALKALKEGEEHGLKEYQEIIEQTWADTTFKNTIRETYIPKQRAHIEALDGLMKKIDQS